MTWIPGFNGLFYLLRGHHQMCYISPQMQVGLHTVLSWVTRGYTAVVPLPGTQNHNLERIKQKATKMIPELRHLSYESRFLKCGLTTLETRRLRGDQIEVFKIVNGYEDFDGNMFFKLKEGSRIR